MAIGRRGTLRPSFSRPFEEIGNPVVVLVELAFVVGVEDQERCYGEHTQSGEQNECSVGGRV